MNVACVQPIPYPGYCAFVESFSCVGPKGHGMTPESGQAADTPDTEAFAASDTVARLRRGYATGVTRSVQWRKKQLKALARMLVDNEPAIIEALGQDQGRAPFETWLIDIALTAGEARHAAKNVSKWGAAQAPCTGVLAVPPARCWVEYEPFGTVLIIGAWNFPFSLTLGPAIGAIAAGQRRRPQTVRGGTDVFCLAGRFSCALP